MKVKTATGYTPKVVNSSDDVEYGKMYRTSRGSVVCIPKPRIGVPHGYYLTILHFASEGMAMSLAKIERSLFPWTELPSGESVTLEQE